jgi:hypothetical protein
MSRLSRSVVAAVFAVVVLFSNVPAYAVTRDGGRGGDLQRLVVRVVKTIRHLFTPAPSDDLIAPPKP